MDNPGPAHLLPRAHPAGIGVFSARHNSRMRAQHQFRLYYQVQVDSLRRPLGAEVLLRRLHPQRGLISPAQFIPLAEETGSIVPIGLWVLQTARAQVAQWHRNPLPRDIVPAVNVSAKQFRQPNFVAHVQHALRESGVKPTHLKLELTESHGAGEGRRSHRPNA